MTFSRTFDPSAGLTIVKGACAITAAARPASIKLLIHRIFKFRFSRAFPML